MKFRLKMMLTMVGLLAVLFGVGGSLLISYSFDSSLEREKASAQGSYEILLQTMSVVGSMNVWTSNADISNMLEQLYKQGSSWSALRLSANEKNFYENGSLGENFKTDHALVNEGNIVVTVLSSNNGNYLQLSGVFKVNEELVYLDALQDISSIYQARVQQQDVYRIAFLVLMALCAVCAYGMSWLITRPLSKLSSASRKIAAGNLSARSNIRSTDELGEVSTEFDRMAQQVEKSVTDMQISIDRQERFMGSFAHELKTPMTAIIGYADLIQKGILNNKEQVEAAHYIFSEGTRLESLSLKLLDIFVLDKHEVKFSLLSPSTLIEETLFTIMPSLKNENISLWTQLEPGQCYLEPDLVKSLLINLVDNARKATGSGGTIEVISTMIPAGVRIQVIDNGKGIPAESLKYLAEAFYRVDVSRSRLQGGAGLGLTLCAKICELHGGTLHVESRLGRGTSMTAVLKGGRP